jgi:regulator of nucleoside diphosphate kinase
MALFQFRSGKVDERRQIYITEFDLKRLREVILEQKRVKKEGREYIESLELELERGKVVSPKEVPPDVVTMNSKVRVEDLEYRDEMIFTLVFPDDADHAQSKVSVLAPLGTAVLGYRVGDIFRWKVPAGVREFRVKEILYQPEASGDYHL